MDKLPKEAVVAEARVRVVAGGGVLKPETSKAEAAEVLAVAAFVAAPGGELRAVMRVPSLLASNAAAAAMARVCGWGAAWLGVLEALLPGVLAAVWTDRSWAGSTRDRNREPRESGVAAEAAEVGENMGERYRAEGVDKEKLRSPLRSDAGLRVEGAAVTRCCWVLLPWLLLLRLLLRWLELVDCLESEGLDDGCAEKLFGCDGGGELACREAVEAEGGVGGEDSFCVGDGGGGEAAVEGREAGESALGALEATGGVEVAADWALRGGGD